MKTLYHLIILVLISFATKAQNHNDFSASFISPLPNETLYNNTLKDLKFLITNNGKSPILTTDTIFMVPLINGEYFRFQGEVIWWFQMLRENLLPTKSDTVIAQINPFFSSQVNGADLCAYVLSSYDGVYLDTLIDDNYICTKVNLSPNGLSTSEIGQFIQPKVFPNPVVGIVNIQLPFQSKDDRVIIYDNAMREVLSTTITGLQAAIDVSHLSQGFYYISWRNSLQKLAVQGN
jgi:hypothetical protein